MLRIDGLTCAGVCMRYVPHVSARANLHLIFLDNQTGRTNPGGSDCDKRTTVKDFEVTRGFKASISFFFF